ncbi:hypothetical protein [Subtercola sp. YIM 133946]|uniref:hypothetical protein n=1 Tax=Subtercola sp. YIM 133946 TaxID=3118909 RepID=UPI002F928599
MHLVDRSLEARDGLGLLARITSDRVTSKATTVHCLSATPYVGRVMTVSWKKAFGALMIRRFITINKACYAVPSAEVFTDLKSEVVAAISAGVGMVDLPMLDNRAVSVVITPHQMVLFEERFVYDDFEAVGAGAESYDNFAEFDY